MKKILVAGLLIAFSFPAISQLSLKVMTFNIRLNIPVDSLNGWQYRKDHLASMVLFNGIHILGVQEALNNQRKDLLQRLPGFQCVGIGRDNNETWAEYNAIFYDTARLHLLHSETFWLSENIHAVGKKGWDAAYPRIITWARFRDRKTKKIFFVFNTHFDNEGKIARRESAHLLLKKVKEIAGNYPVMVTGDFNCYPADEPIKIITDKADSLHLTDTKEISKAPHYGPEGTFNNFESKEINDQPIDYIFIRNKVRVLQHATLSQSWKGRFASDHFPVFVKLLIE